MEATDLNFGIDEQAAASGLGFRYGRSGAHTSRTIMLAELSQVLEATPIEADRTDYVTAIVDGNVTEKKTVATRRQTLQRLTELYGFEPKIVLFRVLRRFWDCDNEGRPLLALLCSLARDPLLRQTANVILSLNPGEELSRIELSNSVVEFVGQRLNESSADKVVRNTSSSWTQSGHLDGRIRKIRQRVEATPLSTAYALLLGYLQGVRGRQLLRTVWAATLDATPDQLLFLAKDAKRLGAIDLKQAGDVVEFGFSGILRPDEIRNSHGTH